MSRGSTSSPSGSSSSGRSADTAVEWGNVISGPSAASTSFQNRTDSLLHYDLSFTQLQEQQRQLVLLQQQPQPAYRRMTPQEDLVATLLGIDVLVRQRQELIDRLVGHHQKLARKNEIGALTDFSREIDRIMKLRGLGLMTPDLSRRQPANLSAAPTQQQQHNAVEAQQVSTDWDEFSLRKMDGGSGLRSLQKLLHIDAESKRKRKEKKGKSKSNTAKMEEVH